MITLTVLFVLVALFLAISVSSANRRRRRLLEQERRRQEELARHSRGGATPPASPFGETPFGPLLEGLLMGPGSWSRALEYDEETGRWVDVTDRAPEQPQPQAEAQPRRQRRSRARAPAPPRRRRTR